MIFIIERGEKEKHDYAESYIFVSNMSFIQPELPPLLIHQYIYRKWFFLFCIFVIIKTDQRTRRMTQIQNDYMANMSNDEIELLRRLEEENR
jgi:hypothetical protein